MGRIDTDEELLIRVRAGERAAFETIVDRYQRLVCGVCFSATRDWALSEDLAQDTFVTAWRRVETLRQPERLSAWLCGIARNLSHKARRRSKPSIAIEDLEEPASPDQSPLDVILERETEAVIARALAGLPETYREPLVLYYQHGQSAREVGTALGLSVTAVHQRVSRARRLLEDEVRELVETTLSRNRPSKGLTAAVLATFGLGAGSAHGATVPHGMLMSTSAWLSAGIRAAMVPNGMLMSTSAWLSAGIGAFVVLFALSAPFERPAPSRIPPQERPSWSEENEVKRPLPSRPPEFRVVRAPRRERAAPSRAPSDSGSKTGYATYTLKGVKNTWARGAIDDLLQSCFEGAEASSGHRFALEPSHPTWLIRPIEGPPVREATLSCIARRLSAFGLEPEEGANLELDHVFKKTDPTEVDLGVFDRDELEGGPFLGARDAAATMVVFTSFKCLFCGRLLGTVDQLLEEYDGRLKVVVRPYALLETDVPLTEAAYAAEAQGLFFALHDEMLADQAGLSRQTLRTFARQADLDLERFDADMRLQNYRRRVERERAEARRAGVLGVPFTVLGDRYINGAQPIEVFRRHIDAILEAR